jgi:hypothetical protein
VLTGVLGLRGPIFASTVETVAEPVSDKPDARRKGFLTVLSAVLFTAMALAAGFVAGVQVTGGRVVLWPLSVVRPDPAASLRLGLHAEAAGDRVRLTWSKESVPIHLATGGTLYVQEGDDTRVIPLRPEEVRDGSVLHLPQGETVRFRLELSLVGERTFTEAVEWKR